MGVSKHGGFGFQNKAMEIVGLVQEWGFNQHIGDVMADVIDEYNLERERETEPQIDVFIGISQNYQFNR